MWSTLGYGCLGNFVIQYFQKTKLLTELLEENFVDWFAKTGYMIQQKDSIFCHISKATSLLTRSNISKISQIVRETTLLKLTLNVQIPSIVHLIRVKPLFLSYFIFQLHLTPMITIFFPKGSRNFIGLSDITLNWFCFYLSYCSQYVYSNETHFKPASVYHGISQVSVHYLDH